MLRSSRRCFILNTWSDDDELLTLKISALSSDGAGISRTDRGIIFVQGGLPGETVRAKIVMRKKDFMVADTVSVRDELPQSASITDGAEGVSFSTQITLHSSSSRQI